MGRTEMCTFFRLENLKEKDHFEDSVNVKITLQQILNMMEADWTNLAWDRGKLRAVVNTVMNSRIP
jgi:hypothetical protein